MGKCAHCGQKATQMCSKCKSVVYCNADHQRLHWSEHKLSCKKVKVDSDSSRPNFASLGSGSASGSGSRIEETSQSPSSPPTSTTSQLTISNITKSCQCMFCGESMLLTSENEAIQHMEICPALQEQLNDPNQFTLPQSIKPTTPNK